ncbi:hypothetical protein ABEU20_001040 [Rhodococcus sp. PAM 2766]|uniref:AraC family transcriptional regulator n=1 Tax=Rhodococcus parequi TaxID=3137122 RepID=A0ABW9FAD2_9NOCA
MTAMAPVPPRKPPPWDGRLTLTPGAVLYRGVGGDSGLHAHHAVQVMVSLDEPFGPRGRGLGLAADRARGGEFEDAMERIAIDHADDSDAVRTIDTLVRAIAPDGPPRPARLSEPVLSALRQLESEPGSRATLGHAAAAAHISPSRLTHLFTAKWVSPSAATRCGSVCAQSVSE